MKSNKQRSAEIKAARKARQSKKARLERQQNRKMLPAGTAPVNPELLASCNSYGAPDYVYKGYYQNLPFQCQDCGKEEIWTAAQQKWWYEVAKGFVYSTATRCRSCRRKERERRAEARRVHLEGLARKQDLQKRKARHSAGFS